MKVADQIRLILTEGTHAGSHKFALLRAILDYVVEKSPKESENLEIPLIYIAEKFLTYYWVMYLNGVRQLRADNQFLYYEYLNTLVDELGLPSLNTGLLTERHIHTLLDALKNADRYSPKTLTALNRTRINLFNGPVKHTLYVSLRTGPTALDMYEFPEGPPGRVEAKTYPEFYENEFTHVIVRKGVIRELKEMYFWFERAIISAWAEFTDRLAKNGTANHTGLTLLAIPKPDRGSLRLFRKHFEDLGVDTCAYCNGPFSEIDHVIPWKMVKSDHFWNMLPICRSCNSSKSDRIWALNEGAKNILRDSIADIVGRCDDTPYFKNQIIELYTHIRKKPPFGDRRALTNDLYEMTMTRIKDFANRI